MAPQVPQAVHRAVERVDRHGDGLGDRVCTLAVPSHRLGARPSARIRPAGPRLAAVAGHHRRLLAVVLLHRRSATRSPDSRLARVHGDRRLLGQGDADPFPGVSLGAAIGAGGAVDRRRRVSVPGGAADGGADAGHHAGDAGVCLSDSGPAAVRGDADGGDRDERDLRDPADHPGGAARLLAGPGGGGGVRAHGGRDELADAVVGALSEQPPDPAARPQSDDYGGVRARGVRGAGRRQRRHRIRGAEAPAQVAVRGEPARRHRHHPVRDPRRSNQPRLRDEDRADRRRIEQLPAGMVDRGGGAGGARHRGCSRSSCRCCAAIRRTGCSILRAR